MNMHATDLVRKESVEELCGHRARAVELYGVAVDRLREAMKAHTRATQMGGRASLPSLAIDSNDRWGKLDEFVGKMTVRLDRDIWGGLITGTPIGSLMDAEERKAFQQSLDKDPPPATAENVRATMERLLGESDMIFRRGLVNAFKKLDRDYASNDGFKIGDRIVLTYGARWCKIMNYFTLHSSREAELHDIDRVMHVLDGKPAPEYSQGLGGALHTLTYSRGEGKTTCETEYWRCRLFKNGNIHLWPLRADLLAKANKIIAEHFGMVVPASRAARQAEPDYQPKPGQSLSEDFFATPEAAASIVMDLAGIEEDMFVLEPSAGEGGLAHHIYPLLRHPSHLWCMEIDPGRCQKLNEGMDGIVSECIDFLTATPERMFDRIVMNPPFAQQQDMRHVLHALRFLKPGGRLVAIMGSGAQWRTDRLAVSFRKITVETLGGVFAKLPAGSFKESGTAVDTYTLTINMPEHTL